VNLSTMSRRLFTIIFCIILSFLPGVKSNAQFNITPGRLTGSNLINPASLQFIDTGDHDNYVKIALKAKVGQGGASPFTATWDQVDVSDNPVTSTGSWQTVTPSSGIDTAREENAYVQAGDKFYLLGGRRIKPAQAYDPVIKSWTNRASPPIELHHFQAVTLNGLIYAAGAFTGAYPREVPVKSVYIFNPATNKWQSTSTIPTARRRGSAGTVVYKNKIYLVGGITDGHWSGWVNWFDEYDPAKNTWKVLPAAPRTRDHFHAVVKNDKLYVVGGRRSSGSTGQVFELTVPEVDVYDFITGRWSTLPTASNLPTPRAGASTALLGDEVIVIGGEDAQPAAYKTTEALNVTNNTWRRLADLQQARHGTQAIVNNTNIFIAAGAGTRGGSMLLNSQELFNFFTPATPEGSAIVQSHLSTPSSVNFGVVPLNFDSVKKITINNTTGNQDIFISSAAITGSTSYTVTAPFTMPFLIPVGKSVVFNVKLKPLSSGSQTGSLVLKHSTQTGTTAIALSGEGGGTPAYRINTGGKQVTTSMGTFSADARFSPTPGYTYYKSSAIAATTDDTLYKTERSATINNGTFSYAFPVSNGQYSVVLHFAEIYFRGPDLRKFDVSIEGIKVLDNYDIYRKVGAFTATKEAFNVNVADGTLNIFFSALAADGGVNRPKISAIEIFSGNAATQTLSHAVSIPVVADNVNEGIETFTGQSSSPIKATNSDGSSTVTIRNGTATVDSTVQPVEQGATIEAVKINITVSVMPNPATNNFNVIVRSVNNKPIYLKVTDLMGRTVQQMSNVLPNRSVSLGAAYYPGFFILEAVQGNERIAVKLIKTKG
jgi:N-acetylneuraminic acid mutarotase